MFKPGRRSSQKKMIVGSPSFERLEGRQLFSTSIGHPNVDLPHSGSGIHGSSGHVSNEQTHTDGTVVSTGDNTITLSNTHKSGITQTTYTLAAGATITADGTAVALSTLPVGAHVNLMLSTTGGVTTVTAITAIGSDVRGVVTAVDPVAGTITFAGHDGGAATTYTIPTSAAVMVNGAAGAVGGITVGDFADIHYSALNSSLILSVSDATPPVTTGTEHHFSHAQGTVVSTDPVGNTITVSSTAPGGTATTTTYTLATGATITADGAAVTLTQLTPGVNVGLVLSTTGGVTTVTAITALGSEVHGAVTAVDPVGGTITLAGHDGGAATTYTIPPTATFTVNGIAGSLGGVTVGDIADIRFAALNSATILSLTDITPPPANSGGEHHSLHAFGTVVSTDTVANTITLSNTPPGGTTTTTTYTLAVGATIFADGGATTLGSLPAGAMVFLQLSSTTPTTVTSITAIGQQVLGSVTAVTSTTITLSTPGSSAPTTYTIPGTAIVTINGVAGSLSSIAIGSFAEIQYSALNPATILNVHAFSGHFDH